MEDAPHSRDNSIRFFRRYTNENAASLKGKIVIDLSAGSGLIAKLFEDARADVRPFDLFPGNNTRTKTETKFIDLQKTLPIGDSTADVVILAETIEHLPDQFSLFKEVSRILKPGAIFLLTTPNTSSLRSRMSQFLTESEHYGSAPPNEVWGHAEWGPGQTYFGKIFLSGILRLRTLAAMNQLRIKILHPSPRSSTSYFLLLLFYPAILFTAWRIRRKQSAADPSNADRYGEIFRLNTSMDVLLSKHLLMEFERRTEPVSSPVSR